MGTIHPLYRRGKPLVGLSAPNKEIVRSDSKLITSSIVAMRDLVVAHGGFVHPAVCIEEHNGDLRVTCDASLANSQILFKVPNSLLVPIDNIIWTNNPYKFELLKYSSPLYSAQSEIIELYISIYNHSKKLKLFHNQPAMTYYKDSDLATQINLVRPGAVVEMQTAAKEFLKTRQFFYPKDRLGIEGENCILPLMDFVNHHHAGANFKQESHHLRLGISHPLNSNECFCNYGGHRDPLDIALQYGFIDPYSPYASSVPATFELPGFKRIEVVGSRTISNHRAAPPTVEFLDDGVKVSNIVGDVRVPQHMLLGIRLAMLASGKRRGISEAVTERAVKDLPPAILAVNREKLVTFQNYLSTRLELPLASLLTEASQNLFANLEKILKL